MNTNNTKRPPTGYYRTLLPAKFQGLRLALADQPMRGVRQVSGAEELAAHLDTLKDPFAAYYANGLRTGALLLIEVVAGSERTYQPGELFLRS